ncbi:uncharacterized protein AMSG_06689 [Thecamonas trahens ATCC 50062]|uniref:Right handed beta helix domain-containing protein n=1 Tax=Thecamonas trahens ATCC 50062 TaxID=461836 RepID=A0A0L0DF72_THETB|nr:hypothetical protein AMSG_06689 [Thecamonas trahens ATCC 50062]KNC50791.1 hypothetical protein AMSG_06689 [Thecamonas trahens ATCC 50062]|eukprot:XP_013756749.1 hypothetical protein AMSG_06689 [Thecamonas trahens ATCC 50062]
MPDVVVSSTQAGASVFPHALGRGRFDAASVMPNTAYIAAFSVEIGITAPRTMPGLVTASYNGSAHLVTTYSADEDAGLSRHVVALEDAIPRVVIPADVDGDSHAELVAVLDGSPSRVRLYRSALGGSTAATIATFSEPGGFGLAVADVNADGSLDIAVTLTAGGIGILLNDGAGSFTDAPSASPPDFANWRWLLFAPLSSSYPDLVAASATGDRVVWFGNDGSGNFGTANNITLPGVVSHVTAADVDVDGNVDLILSRKSLARVHIFVNPAGNGAFSTLASLVTDDRPASATVADFDRNNLPDILVISANGNSLGLFMQTSPGEFTDYPRTTLVDGTAPNTGLLAAGVLSLDGHADAVFSAANSFMYLPWLRGPFAPRVPWVVDMPDCPSLSFIACIVPLLRVPHSSLQTTTLRIPAGTYTSCPTSFVQLRGLISVEAAGGPDSVVIDCEDAPGVRLFDILDPYDSVGSSHATFRGLTFTGISAILAPFQVRDTATLEFVDVAIQSSTVTGGSGAIRVRNSATFIATRGRFVDCTAVENVGGAIEAATGWVRVNGTRFERCSATVNKGGGAIYGNSLDIRNARFEDCSAGESGGAISSTGSLAVSGTTFVDCSSGASGGGISTSVTSSLMVEDSTFERCTSASDGGAIVHRGVTAGLRGVTITDCSAAFLGGAVLVEVDQASIGVSNTVMESVSISSSTATTGGLLACAAHVAGADTLTVPSQIPFATPTANSLVLDGVTLDNGAASFVGGAIFECQCAISLAGAGITSLSGATAGTAGAIGFSCDPAAASFGVSGPPGAKLGTLTGPQLTSYGPGWATPAAQLEFATVLPSKVGSALPLTGVAVRLVDAFGTRLVDSGITVSVSEQSGVFIVLAPGPFRGDNGTFPLDSTGIALAGPPPFAAKTAAVELTTTTASGVRPELPPLSTVVTVGLCPVDYGAIDLTVTTQLTCAPCEPGRISNQESVEPCDVAQACPENMVLENLVENTCVCESGFWARPGRDDRDPCEPCPRGGRCVGDLNPPVPQAGFFPDGPGRFLVCRRKGACVGGSLLQPCARGHEGFLCNKCQTGFFSDPERQCRECPASPGGVFGGFLVGLALVAVGIGAVLVWLLARARRLAALAAGASKGANIRAFRTQIVPASLSMVLVAFQVVGILSEANFEWTSASRQVLAVFNVFNVDTSLFASECALANFHVKYAVSLLFPLLFLAAVVLTMIILRSRLGSLAGVSIRALIDTSVFSLAPLAYIPLCRSSFVLFDCVKLTNGDFVLDPDPGVACFDSAWWSVAPIGIAAVLGFVIGLPVYFVWSLWASRNSLFEPETTARLGALYRLYRRAYYWGEVANLARRLALVVASVFFSEAQLVQLALMMMVLLWWVFAVATLKPYYFPLYNSVDMRLNIVLVAIVMLGAGSYAERNATSSNTFLLVATVAAVVILVGVSVVAIAVDIKRIVQTRNATYLAAAERQHKLMGTISVELRDIEANPDVLRAAGEFLGTLRALADGNGGGTVGAATTLAASPSTAGLLGECEFESGIELDEL